MATTATVFTNDADGDGICDEFESPVVPIPPLATTMRMLRTDDDSAAEVLRQLLTMPTAMVYAEFE